MPRSPLHGSPLHEGSAQPQQGTRSIGFHGNAGKKTVDTTAHAHNLPPGAAETYWAAFPYQAERPDELSFEAGTALHVVARSGPSWWEAMLDTGQRGLVPANFLTPIHPGTAVDPTGTAGKAYHARTCKRRC